jgi:hypothetical protein
MALPTDHWRERLEHNEDVIEGVLLLPDREKTPARFRFTSDFGASGCHGIVIPAQLEGGDETIRVQVKRFYRNSYDDRGDSFSQDPDKMAQQSYDALVELQKLGFNVLPFFGLLEAEAGKLLVMTDLSEDGTKEVIDEKWLHRNTKIPFTQNGEEVEMGAQAVVEGLANCAEIRLGFLQTTMLQYAHHISFGWAGGTEHMIVRDPTTNTGEIVVSDVSEYHRKKSRYKDVHDYEALIQVPEREIKEIFQKILARFHPDLDPEYIYALYGQTQQKVYQDLFYKAAIGMAVSHSLGSVGDAVGWAKQRFVRSEFPDHFLKAKLNLQGLVDHYTKYATPLFDDSAEGLDRFTNPETIDDLLVGIGFAQLAVTDVRMQYLMETRRAIDAEEPLPSQDDFAVDYDENGLQKMKFFDNYNESKGPTCEVEITGRDLQNTYIRITIETDWVSGKQISNSGGMCYVPILAPQQFKRLEINNTSVTDFDPTNVLVYKYLVLGDLKIGDMVAYVYDGEMIYYHNLESQVEIDFITPYLAN